MNILRVFVAALLLWGGSSLGQPSESTGDAGLDRMVAAMRERGQRALDELVKPNFASRPLADRKRVIDDAVAGVDAVSFTISDPEQLQRYASALITHGTLRYVNLIEYWGEDAKQRAVLNPIAQAVDKLAQRAEVLSSRKADELLANVKDEKDELNLKTWQAADNFHRTIVFLWANATYGLAMSYDPSDPKRNTTCQRAIAQLKEYDADGVEIRPRVQLILAKLYMVRGAPSDYVTAKTYFKKVLDGTGAKSTEFVNEQYSARYFAIVLDLTNHRVKEAQAALGDLRKWQDANMPKDKATQDGVMAAEMMLRWRIKEALALGAKSPDEKKKLHDEAVQIMVELADRRPDLRALIVSKVGPGVLDADDVIGLGVGKGNGTGKK